jgi:hypothetical protein
MVTSANSSGSTARPILSFSATELCMCDGKKKEKAERKSLKHKIKFIEYLKSNFRRKVEKIYPILIESFKVIR